MSDKNLKKPIIKFCVKIGKIASETVALLTVVYGVYVLKKSSVFEWHGGSRKGQKMGQDDRRSGQPNTQRTNANVDKVRTLAR
jgi:hypothetical protein